MMWKYFSQKLPPVDAKIYIRRSFSDGEVKEIRRHYFFRYAPTTRPLSCDYKLEFRERGKVKRVGAFLDILDGVEWRIADE